MFDDGTVLQSEKALLPDVHLGKLSTLTTQGTLGSKATLGSKGSHDAPDSSLLSDSPAPKRDFMRVANSIGRTAMRAGLFTGKGKQIYDYLYSRTRGAIVPVRSVQVSRREIMEGAHVGSDKTLRENLSRLRGVGLITWEEQLGAHAGNLYTVYLPEETLTTQGTQGTEGSDGQILPIVLRAETTQGTEGLNDDSLAGSAIPKTSFKTNTERSDDDEAAASFARAARTLIKEITGKEATKAELEKMVEVMEVITLEGKIAAARTTVSSAGPFLAEHLRRRLFKKGKQEIAAETAVEGTVSAAVDASGCPDCAGVGWYYPEGKEKGMAKCRHPRLVNGDLDTPGLAGHSDTPG